MNTDVFRGKTRSIEEEDGAIGYIGDDEEDQQDASKALQDADDRSIGFENPSVACQR